MDERDLKKKIEEEAEQILVPDSLKPERIEKLLEEKGKKRRKSFYYKTAAFAACAVVVVGLAAVGISGGLPDFAGEADTQLAAGTAEDRAGSTEAADSIEETENTENGTSASGESEEHSVGTSRDKADSDSGSSGKKFKVTSIKTAKNYDEIYEYLEAEYQKYNQEIGSDMYMESIDSNDAEFSGSMEKSAVSKDSAMDLAAPADGGSSAGNTAGYSDTNVREEGVGEADIVKTDGKCLYIVKNRQIQIVGIEKKEMEQLSVIELEKECYVSELFVKKDRLVVMYTDSEYLEPLDGEDGDGGYYRDLTVAETFDIGNPKKPKSIGKISQSGNYNTMRAVGDYIYLFSDYYVYMDMPRTARDRYIPEVQGKRIDSGDILMPWNTGGNKYTVISAFSMKDPEEKINEKAIFGTAGMCYVSSGNIYITEEKYDNDAEVVSLTCIRKVAYHDGELEAVGQTIIDGTLNDSFSIDEYKDNLRLVVTVRKNTSKGQKRGDGILPLLGDDTAEVSEWTDSNSLYILDGDLEELSRIEGLAPDETVYSARFMGDTGYFVTFRQMDPLFSVDLSDPENPKIIGRLKIPGFSDYLHPYGEGQLLGIGMDVDETGTSTQGVKLSMFDISDPANVEEVQKYVLENTYSTDVSYNYKAAFVDVEKNLIGFSAYGDEMKYYIFSYETNGFTKKFERDLTGYSSDVRALYAGSRLYLVSGNTVESYDMETFEKIDDIVL